ncbi:hypothetical protein [Nissabacter sp. SGAir0207]|uniref:hypothetical protein n=1 Tax=Nissabacter sp. SGAir0207 TaxID=2126321 RepID=UPI0010CD08DE|nr:hypothetical protein [Nissabacter sp. SGAir0207]QCR36633.1 hypothetical protein C1N62_11275 [Nissabacter sp. SGAir0207]
MRTLSRLATTLIAALALSGAAHAAPAGDIIKPMRGTLDQVTDHSLTLTDRRGAKVEVGLTDQTRINSVATGKISDIKPDSFIGTAAAPQPDGTLKALEVHVFAPSLRGSGEGFNPFESADGKVNTMTNGTVGKLVESNGRTLTVKYHDQQKTVIVPDDVPVVTLAPGDRSLLTPGAHVVLFANKQADGSLAARGISVGKDGIVPPM